MSKQNDRGTQSALSRLKRQVLPFFVIGLTYNQMLETMSPRSESTMFVIMPRRWMQSTMLVVMSRQYPSTNSWLCNYAVHKRLFARESCAKSTRVLTLLRREYVTVSEQSPAILHEYKNCFQMRGRVGWRWWHERSHHNWIGVNTIYERFSFSFRGRSAYHWCT